MMVRYRQQIFIYDPMIGKYLTNAVAGGAGGAAEVVDAGKASSAKAADTLADRLLTVGTSAND